VQVLRLCAEAGLVKVSVVALDGTKVKANASLSANRTYEAIREARLRVALRGGAGLVLGRHPEGYVCAVYRAVVSAEPAPTPMTGRRALPGYPPPC